MGNKVHEFDVELLVEVQQLLILDWLDDFLKDEFGPEIVHDFIVILLENRNYLSSFL